MTEESEALTVEDEVIETYKASGLKHSYHGIIYQEELLMMALLKGGVDKRFPFRLASEMDAAEKFDDLVLEYRKPEGLFHCFVQAKHKRSEAHKITVDQITTQKDGQFSLQKYFLSFLKIKKNDLFSESTLEELLIWTNITFQFKKFEVSNIRLVEVKETDNILRVDGTSDKKPARYKLQVDKEHELYKMLRETKRKYETSKREEADDVDEDAEIDDFLEKLVFAVNQLNIDELEEAIKEEISSHGKPKYNELNTNNIYSKLKCKVTSWINDQRGTYLSHKDIDEFMNKMEEDILGKIWFEVGHLVDTFTGREEELKRVDEMLRYNREKDEFTIISQVSSVSGLGGVGKTELARKYAYEHAAHYNDNVIWINAETRDTLTASFTRLAKEKLGISLLDKSGKERETVAIVEDVYAFFANKKCLFIFDNAEQFESEVPEDAGINRFLVSLPPGHQVFTLITSRNQDWGKVKPVVLDIFSAEEAAEFVRKELNVVKESEESAVKKLTEILNCFPLALRQAVSYIREVHKKRQNIGSSFEIVDYVKMYTDKAGQDKTLVNYNVADKRSVRYMKTTFTTWQITRDVMATKPDGELALQILNIMAYLQPVNIDVRNLFTGLVEDITCLGSAVELLKNYSMINSGEDRSVVNIHRLVQEVTRIKLKEQDKEEKIVLNALELVDKATVEMCTDHARMLWSFARHHEKLMRSYDHVPWKIVEALRRKVRYKEAREFGVEANEYLSPLLGESHESCLSLRHEIAFVLDKQGKYEEAVSIYEEVYKKQEVVLGADHPETLSTKHNMAFVLTFLGKYDEALAMHREVYERELVVLGEDDPDLMTSLHCIARVLLHQGKHEEALVINQQLYEKRKVLLGPDHEATLLSLHNMAFSYGAQGDNAKAYDIYNQVFEKNKRNQGVDHPVTLKTQFNIAASLVKQSRYEEGLEVFKDVYGRRMNVLGPDHPDTVDALNRAEKTSKLVGSE